MADLLTAFMNLWALVMALFGLLLMVREFDASRRGEWVSLGLCAPPLAWLAYLAGAELLSFAARHWPPAGAWL